jgi:hypothetical protein
MNKVLGYERMRSLEVSQRRDWKVFGQRRVSEPCQCPIIPVVSMGRRNTFLRFTRRSLKT